MPILHVPVAPAQSDAAAPSSQERTTAIHQTLLALIDTDTDSDTDAAILVQLIDSLFQTAGQDLTAYQQACDAGDWEQAGSLAHRIKGTARMTGCHTLIDLSEQIEAAAATRSASAVLAINVSFLPRLRQLILDLQTLRAGR